MMEGVTKNASRSEAIGTGLVRYHRGRLLAAASTLTLALVLDGALSGCGPGDLLKNGNPRADAQPTETSIRTESPQTGDQSQDQHQGEARPAEYQNEQVLVLCHTDEIFFTYTIKSPSKGTISGVEERDLSGMYAGTPTCDG